MKSLLVEGPGGAEELLLAVAAGLLRAGVDDVAEDDDSRPGFRFTVLRVILAGP